MKPDIPPLHERLDVDRFGIRALCWRLMPTAEGPMPVTAARADELAQGLVGPAGAADLDPQAP